MNVHQNNNIWKISLNMGWRQETLYYHQQEEAVQFLVFANDVNFIDKRKKRKENAEAAVDASEQVSLEINTEKYVGMCSYLFNGIQGKFVT